MFKVLAVSIAMSGLAMFGLAMSGSMMSVASAAAVTPVSSTQAVCDQEAPVCGVMNRGRLVSFRNECQARDAGALKVVYSGCYDED